MTNKRAVLVGYKGLTVVNTARDLEALVGAHSAARIALLRDRPIRPIRLSRADAERPTSCDWAAVLNNSDEFPIGRAVTAAKVMAMTGGEVTIEVDVQLEFDEVAIFKPPLVPNRPSEEGRALGKELARLCDGEAEKLRHAGLPVPERCKSCAFTEGTVPNGCASTALDATLSAINGIDFFCHMGVKPGEEPTKLCAGYLIMKSQKAGS